MSVSPNIRKLYGLSRQIPFWAAKSLTATVKVMQTEGIARLSSGADVITRANYEPSNKFGLRIRPATKTKLSATLFTQADWLVHSEKGGLKRPTKTRKLAQAVVGSAARRTVTQAVNRRLTPKKLGKKNRIAVRGKLPSGDVGIFRIVGRGRRKKAELLYVLKSSVKVPRRSPVIEPAKKVFRARHAAIFRRELAEVLKTARP